MNSDCIILELLDGVGKLKEEVTNLKKGPRGKQIKKSSRTS